MKWYVFTNFNLLLLIIGYNLGIKSDLWCISCCNMFGTFVSFSIVPFYDKTAYKRQRIDHNVSGFLFYTGHVILHICPIIFILLHVPVNIGIWHCYIAFMFKLLWAYVSCGSIYLDKVYTKLSKDIWEKVWLLSFFSHFLPIIIKSFL